MRIGLVANVPETAESVLDGVARATASLVRALMSAGVDIEIIAPAGDRCHRGEYAGATVHFVKADSRGGLFTGYRSFVSSVRRSIESMRCDIVQAQGMSVMGLAAVGVRDRARVVVAHGNAESDVMHAYPSLSGLVRSALIRHHCVRVVDAANVVVNVTQDWTVNLPKRPNEQVWIPNIVDERFFDVRSADNSTRIVFLGGARRIKGADILVEAFKILSSRNPNLSLDLYGGSDEEFLSIIEGPLPSGVRLCGRLRAAGVEDVLSEGCICVVPSRYEVSPMVVAECWAAGIPVVASRVGGIESMMRGATGDGESVSVLLCDPHPDQLARGLMLAVESETVRNSLVEAGRKCAETHRAGKIAEQYISLYEDLLSNRKMS